MKQIGVIDCGSNSFTLVIARVEEGHWVREFANSLPVGLGAGGFMNATIRADRFARGLDALGVFRETLRNYGVDAVYVTGTSALRDARNADEFVKAVADRLDLAVEVISGAQEAFAIWKGASLTEPLEGEDVGLLMDIGGGSVEFAIWPNGGAWKWLKSVDAGVVRMKDYAKPQDPLQQQGADRLLPFIDEVLAPVHAAIAEWRPNVLVGSSGSFDAMASLLRRGEALPDEGAPHATAERLDRSALKVLHREALAAPLTERLAWKGMPSSRAPYLPLASVLVQNVLQHLDAASPVPVRVARSPYALREGLVELAVGADLAPSLEFVWPNLNP
jgi:exopolyphosphatase/guanosine-5'-triphosphate,3'-diphosphate pyrophosphatase